MKSNGSCANVNFNCYIRPAYKVGHFLGKDALMENFVLHPRIRGVSAHHQNVVCCRPTLRVGGCCLHSGSADCRTRQRRLGSTELAYIITAQNFGGMWQRQATSPARRNNQTPARGPRLTELPAHSATNRKACAVRPPYPARSSPCLGIRNASGKWLTYRQQVDTK